MSAVLADFHFIRPWWLLALVPGLWLCLQLWRYRGDAAWKQVIEPELLTVLLQGSGEGRRRGAAVGVGEPPGRRREPSSATGQPL